MALTTGSFGSGLGDAGLSESKPTNAGGNWAPNAGAPVTDEQFGVYPIDRPATGNQSAPENALDYGTPGVA